ncbi:MAG TPA: 2-phospho-L-lactate guanylyltransferase [Nocardioidaceae bacterium]|nr:2-phospho-L-lactate guanylyltransferase [Nocardioidaceae bacterium]
MSISLPDRRFAVLVPVKPPSVAKSRLVDLGDHVRHDLVVAFAADTATAALKSSMVGAILVVTDDFALAAGLRELGADVIPDGAVDDLNESLVQAAAEAERRWPELCVAALCADVPALASDELTMALAAAPPDRACFVTDAEGVGTTMLAAPGRELFTPRFGPDSRQAHLAAGAVELDSIDVPTLRRDVDTPADLVAAVQLGVGARTATTLARLRL